MDVGIVVVLLLTLLVAGAPAPADATGIRITVTSPVPHRRPNDIRHGPVGDHIHRRPDVIHRAPVVVVPQPVYITVPRRCLDPGYWAYSWVPQSYVSNVWVPGSYNSDALWAEGHYEARAYTWGSYQPYWVSERWTLC
jgi:hypothetical protein